MTEPSKDCPLCGARLEELNGLIQRVNDVMASEMRARRIETIVMRSLVVFNVGFLVFFLVTR